MSAGTRLGAGLLLAWLSMAAAATPAPKAALDHFIQVFNALDWQAFRECFADEASLFNPDVPGAVSLHRLDGRAEVERAFQVVFGQGSPHVTPEKVRVQRYGGTAVLSFEFMRSGQSFGRRTIVMNLKQNRWLIVHIHASNVG